MFKGENQQHCLDKVSAFQCTKSNTGMLLSETGDKATWKYSYNIRMLVYVQYFPGK